MNTADFGGLLWIAD